MARMFQTAQGNPSVNAGSAQVLERQRADGVHPDVQALLDAWTQEGTFDVTVAGGAYPGGGLRSALDVAKAASMGLSNATSLSTTPHGRGAAIDLWPAGFNPDSTMTAQPDAMAKFQQLGAFYQSHGFVWGGGFTSIVAPDGTQGDLPHGEMQNWQSLPYPPPDYGTSSGATVASNDAPQDDSVETEDA